MDTINYLGFPIRKEDDEWCLNLGIEKGTQCFSSLDAAKAAVDARITEIEEETKGRP